MKRFDSKGCPRMGFAHSAWIRCWHLDSAAIVEPMKLNCDVEELITNRL